MTRYIIEIEFDGTNYVGWQKQENAMSVQEAISNAIFAYSSQKTEIVASGRTDSGVHAICQTAHFDLDTKNSTYSIQCGINHHLIKKNHQISILSCQKAPADFHARFSAKQRQYVYKLINRQAPLAIDAKRAWQIKKPLNINKMQEAAKFFLGTHNFSSFRASICQSKNPIKTIDYLEIHQKCEEISIEIGSESFLHHMVRNIVGTLVLVGKGKIAPNDIPNIIKAQNRTKAGQTAPAHGLYFKKAIY